MQALDILRVVSKCSKEGFHKEDPEEELRDIPRVAPIVL